MRTEELRRHVWATAEHGMASAEAREMDADKLHEWHATDHALRRHQHSHELDEIQEGVGL